MGITSSIRNYFFADPELVRIKRIVPQITKDELIDRIERAVCEKKQEIIEFYRESLSREQLKNFFPCTNLDEAQEEALFLPDPFLPRETPSTTWSSFPRLGNKFLQYIGTTIEKSYGIDLNSPPRSTWSAQTQLNIFRSIITDSKWLFEIALVYFVTIQKTVLAAAGVFISLFALQKIYSYFHLSTPEEIGGDQITNLSRKAEEKQFNRSIGRIEEMQSLVASLTPSPLEKTKITFLVGPPGVGKTQLVQSLAQEISEGRAPTLKGKTVFGVNTASLNEYGNYSETGYTSRFDLILKAIEGYEKDVILFFDEAHNVVASSDANSSKQGRGHLIETLKTKLLERNISVILATTKKEYDQCIVPNEAFVERTDTIYVNPLDESQTKLLLQETIQGKKIDVSSDAIDTVLEIGNTSIEFQERALPRKAFDILQKGVRHVLAWEPSSLKKELEAEEIKLRSLKTECSKSVSQKEDLLLQLKEKLSHVEKLRDALQKQSAMLKTIRNLNAMEKTFFQKHCHTVHKIKAIGKPDESLQRDYLFFKAVLFPLIQKTLSRKVTEFESSYGEKIPLKVDSALLKRLHSDV